MEEVQFFMNEFNDEDLDIGSDSFIGDLIGEILGFLTFVAIIYWLGDKLSELRDRLSEWWEDITTKRRRAKKRDLRVRDEGDYAAILRDRIRIEEEEAYELFEEVTWDFQDEIDRQIEFMRPVIRAISHAKNNLESAGLEVRLLDKRSVEIKTSDKLVNKTGRQFDMLIRCKFLGDQIEVLLFDEETWGELRAFEDVDSAMSFVLNYFLEYFVGYSE
jgi:hypothetical protein